MKIIKVIGKPDKSETELELRSATRGVFQDANGLVPLLYVSKFKYHKLPGGGIEKGEDIRTALARECMEEIGAKIEIIAELGIIIEYRLKWNLKQTSYCFYGKIVSKGGQQQFTERELSQGFELEWHPLEMAIEIVKNDRPGNYEGGFIQERDLTILSHIPPIYIPS